MSERSDSDEGALSKTEAEYVSLRQEIRAITTAEAEYVSLRQEIRAINAEIIAVATFVLTAAGGALLITFQVGNPIGALLPLGLLYFGTRVVYNNGLTVARISTYIKVFWEETGSQYQWETMLAQYREKTKQSRPKGFLQKLGCSIASLGLPSQKEGASLLDREVWAAPLFEEIFAWFGAFCLLVYVWIAAVVISNYPQLKESAFTTQQELIKHLMLPGRTINALVLVVVGIIALCFVIWMLCKTYGRKDSISQDMVKEMTNNWKEIKNNPFHTQEVVQNPGMIS